MQEPIHTLSPATGDNTRQGIYCYHPEGRGRQSAAAGEGDGGRARGNAADYARGSNRGYGCITTAPGACHGLNQWDGGARAYLRCTGNRRRGRIYRHHPRGSTTCGQRINNSCRACPGPCYHAGGNVYRYRRGHRSIAAGPGATLGSISKGDELPRAYCRRAYDGRQRVDDDCLYDRAPGAYRIWERISTVPAASPPTTPEEALTVAMAVLALDPGAAGSGVNKGDGAAGTYRRSAADSRWRWQYAHGHRYGASPGYIGNGSGTSTYAGDNTRGEPRGSYRSVAARPGAAGYPVAEVGGQSFTHSGAAGYGRGHRVYGYSGAAAAAGAYRIGDRYRSGGGYCAAGHYTAGHCGCGRIAARPGAARRAAGEGNGAAGTYMRGGDSSNNGLWVNRHNGCFGTAATQ